ncbi:hypothetical protein EDB87DRAFT_1691472 [Lactarius vividus]|nr:hypothetical protein EDB87DRAFT_1691472 [Lactarius vividus]
MFRKTQRRNESQGADFEKPEDEEVRQEDAHQITRMSGHEGEVSGATGSDTHVEAIGEAQASSTSSQAEAPKGVPSIFGIFDQPGDDDETPDDDTVQPVPSELPRMIGDFDDNANALWSLHVKEAMSHDEARIQSLKGDMDGVLIFAAFFSISLASFLVDKIHDLRPDPAQQMVYYQQQNVALLAQISKQVSSIAPQISIPSTPPPPYVFNLNPSDVRVNVFWFMSLVFSISAALLATLVQQWVRDYMHVFQRYSNPLKSARLRQYLYEGAEGWYMPVVAESVPGLVHVSLFLFFLGLGDSLLNVNTTVGVTTVVPITLCALLYVFSMFAPVIKPQSPFRNPFSGLIWYLRQKVHPRRYLDRGSGGSAKVVSSNISQGQMQLAMEENDERKDRDVRAIQWLIHNRTEDDEMESFVMAIPGAFTSKWGIEVWRKASQVKQYEDANVRPNDLAVTFRSDTDLRMSVLLRHHSSPSWRTSHPLRPDTPRDVTMTRVPSDDQVPDDIYGHGDLDIHDLCKRVRHLASTCGNYSIFANKESWHKRARGCVGTAASLVICADIKLEMLGDLRKLFRPLYESTERYHLAPGSDGLFVVRLDCLSFVIISQGMLGHDKIQEGARIAINNLSQLQFGMEDDNKKTNDGDENALENARRIDNYFETARQFCVCRLRKVFRPSEEEAAEEQVKEVLARDNKDDIYELERIALASGHVADIDEQIFKINDSVSSYADGLILYLHGVYFDDFERTGIMKANQFFNPTADRPTFLPQFVYLHQRLRFLCSYSSKLRDIIDGRGNDTYKEMLESLGKLWSELDNPGRNWTGIRRRHLMERQLYRLQDFRDGGGFGYWIEYFFLVTQQHLYIPLSPEAHSAIIVGTFRTITSEWRKYKHSIGTQRVILNLICDLAILGHGLLSDIAFPRYLTDELLIFLGNMVEGQSGAHIDDAMKKMEDATRTQETVPGPRWWLKIHAFRAEAMKVISRLRAPAPSS